MIWDLPLSVEIDGVSHKIRNDCDYRMVLDVICALNDNELTDDEKLKCALYIFYEDLDNCKDIEKAIDEMYKVISGGEKPKNRKENNPKVMDWEHDFPQIAPPISRVLGYDVRTPNKYTHWWSFIGAYMEIGECTFATVISIRQKKAKGKKLEDYERKFYFEHKDIVDLPLNLTQDEKEWLDID